MTANFDSSWNEPDMQDNDRKFFVEADANPPAEAEMDDGRRSNTERAEMAFANVLRSLEAGANDDGDVVANLICNLMHFCDRMPGRYGAFADNLRVGMASYAMQIRGKSPMPLYADLFSFAYLMASLRPYSAKDEQRGEAFANMNELILAARDVLDLATMSEAEGDQQEMAET